MSRLINTEKPIVEFLCTEVGLNCEEDTLDYISKNPDVIFLDFYEFLKTQSPKSIFSAKVLENTSLEYSDIGEKYIELVRVVNEYYKHIYQTATTPSNWGKKIVCNYSIANTLTLGIFVRLACNQNTNVNPFNYKNFKKVNLEAGDIIIKFLEQMHTRLIVSNYCESFSQYVLQRNFLGKPTIKATFEEMLLANSLLGAAGFIVKRDNLIQDNSILYCFFDEILVI